MKSSLTSISSTPAPLPPVPPSTSSTPVTTPITASLIRSSMPSTSSSASSSARAMEIAKPISPSPTTPSSTASSSRLHPRAKPLSRQLAMMVLPTATAIPISTPPSRKPLLSTFPPAASTSLAWEAPSSQPPMSLHPTPPTGPQPLARMSSAQRFNTSPSRSGTTTTLAMAFLLAAVVSAS